MSERLTISKAAARAGMQTETFRKYLKTKHAPLPDGVDETFGIRWWYATTIDEWLINRPGQGARTDLRPKL